MPCAGSYKRRPEGARPTLAMSNSGTCAPVAPQPSESPDLAWHPVVTVACVHTWRAEPQHESSQAMLQC